MENVVISNRISISKKLFSNEYEYMFGKKKFEFVSFYYDHKVRGLGRSIKMTYSKAYKLATERARDRRYKNYNFFISHE